ncbi:MAG: hypothetical protein UE295_06465 [Acutalibacteraceae bacterium]|nr:hypothetical protein [Acutalibacteraceae bacterium]
MSNYYDLTPLNLALDASLEQFIELYHYTKNVYLKLIEDYPKLELHKQSDRDLLNLYAIPMIISEFECLFFRRHRMFTKKYKNIELTPNHFKYFNFFDDKKVREFDWSIEFQLKLVEMGLKRSDEVDVNRDNNFRFQETSIEINQFLYYFRSVVVRAIFEKQKEQEPSYTIFQASKDVGNQIKERMILRHSECKIPKSSNVSLTDEPLYLYDVLNNIGCKRNKHELIPKRYYI